MSWGTGWGYEAWGGGSSILETTSFYIAGARAASSRSVLVTFSQPPNIGSPIDSASATNPSNWEVVNMDNATQFVVLAVQPVSSNPLQVVLVLLTSFDSQASTYEVVANPSMQSVADVAMGDPNFADFTGGYWVQNQTPSQELVDVANPVVPHSPAGQLIVGSNGDYNLEAGTDLLRKLIVRRLVTPKGGFRHLPAYGMGFREKERYSPTQIAKLRAAALIQIAQEPETDPSKTSVQASMDPNGTLTFDAQVPLVNSNQQVDVTVGRKAPDTGV